MSHHITRCSKCDTIISQCRCIDCNKKVKYSLCTSCANAPQEIEVNGQEYEQTIPLEDRYNNVSKSLKEINKYLDSIGAPSIDYDSENYMVERMKKHLKGEDEYIRRLKEEILILEAAVKMERGES